jgi:putative phosphoesterase
MKILIVSDTHRAHNSLTEVVEKEKPLDMMIHLGDVEGGEYYISSLASCPLYMIGGNNDFFTDLPREQEFFIGKYRAFITHGHRYYVTRGEDDLKIAAKQRMVDIVMYGHTHVPVIREEDNLVILNPGSISYPRQEGRKASYVVMEIGEGEEPNVSLKYLEE